MITKPLNWAVHIEKENVVPIFSIDISPGGNAFATGGEDSVVKVWSFAKALSSTSTETTLLADIKVHEKPVNSVRFNHTGRLLASGGSDGVVSVAVWVPSGEPLWKPLRQWHQQKLDVSEVAWGTTGRRHLLASCSFDGSIVIWDVERGHAVQTMTGHGNIIKGLAWDPLGQFLASQADAEGVFIWRTSDWKCVKQISEPFQETVDCSDHLRLSWSPNGMYLTGVQAHALPQPYVAVLCRDRWNLEFCVVGHRSGVSVSKWNPRFFHPRGQRGASDIDPSNLAMCLCLGSLDRTFSLWLQTEKHPILHMDGFFENRISDVAWSADGYTCLVSSRDGFVALCNFTEEDLGVAASYQVSPMDVFPSTSKMPVAENLNFWMLEQEADSTSLPEPQEKRNRLDVLEEERAAELHTKRQKKTSNPEELLHRLTIESQSTSQSCPFPVPTRNPPPTPPLPRETLPNRERKSKTSFTHFCGRREAPDGTWNAVQLSVDNAVGDQKCSIVCIEGDREVWRDEISDKAVAVAGNLNFTAVATDASCINVHDEVGMYLIPSLQLPSSAWVLVSDGDWHLMALTNCGELSLWHVGERRLICRASVCSLCKESQLSSVQFSTNTLPLVVLSDGRSFLYSRSLEAWTLFSDSTQPRTGHSMTQRATEEARELSLDALSFPVSAADVKHEMEQGLVNAMELNSAEHYRNWLLSYIRFLISRTARNGATAKGEEARLRKICIQHLHGHNAEMLDSAPVIFFQRQILPEMMKVRDLQRLTEEIQDWIESM